MRASEGSANSHFPWLIVINPSTRVDWTSVWKMMGRISDSWYRNWLTLVRHTEQLVRSCVLVHMTEHWKAICFLLFFGPSWLQFTDQWTIIQIFQEIIDLLEFQRKIESDEFIMLNHELLLEWWRIRDRRSWMALGRIASVFRDQILVMMRLWHDCVQSEQQGRSHTFWDSKQI
jgi:hypothetical protein